MSFRYDVYKASLAYGKRHPSLGKLKASLTKLVSYPLSTSCWDDTGWYPKNNPVEISTKNNKVELYYTKNISVALMTWNLSYDTQAVKLHSWAVCCRSAFVRFFKKSKWRSQLKGKTAYHGQRVPLDQLDGYLQKAQAREKANSHWWLVFLQI